MILPQGHAGPALPRAAWLAGGGALCVAAGMTVAWFAFHPAAPAPPAAVVAPAPPAAMRVSDAAPLPSAAAPPPRLVAEPIPRADEAAIDNESPAVRTVLRFAPNPAIVVLDFPTLSEQGRMLNRLAAWAEKAGVPHDRLLDDAQLAQAIRASGATADTYYYGHDYRGSDVLRFFALADRDGTVLGPEEQDLRRLAARAGAETDGFGALITLVRASPDIGVTPSARSTILHHELSHGEYFTNPAYAAFVQTVWQSVLTADERAAFRTYLATEGYDPALEDVICNEMQAYLMHTTDREFFDPDRLGIPAPRLAQLRASFMAGMPPGWLRSDTEAALPLLPVPSAPGTSAPAASQPAPRPAPRPPRPAAAHP